jgi:hypothetical protein
LKQKIFAPLLFLVLSLAAAAPAGAADALYLNLTAHGDRLNLGLAQFSSTRSKDDEVDVARRIREIVKKDLEFPRVFVLIEGGPNPSKGKVIFNGWDDLKVDALVVGSINTGWFGRTEFLGALHDVNSKQVILQKRYLAGARHRPPVRQ